MTDVNIYIIIIIAVWSILGLLLFTLLPEDKILSLRNIERIVYILLFGPAIWAAIVLLPVYEKWLRGFFIK
jgi:hypothetical protein